MGMSRQLRRFPTMPRCITRLVGAGCLILHAHGLFAGARRRLKISSSTPYNICNAAAELLGRPSAASAFVDGHGAKRADQDRGSIAAFRHTPDRRFVQELYLIIGSVEFFALVTSGELQAHSSSSSRFETSSCKEIPQRISRLYRPKFAPFLLQPFNHAFRYRQISWLAFR
jgi:hypothetical protein